MITKSTPPDLWALELFLGQNQPKSALFLRDLWKFQMLLISKCVLKPRITFGWACTNWKVTNWQFKTETRTVSGIEDVVSIADSVQ